MLGLRQIQAKLLYIEEKNKLQSPYKEHIYGIEPSWAIVQKKTDVLSRYFDKILIKIRTGELVETNHYRLQKWGPIWRFHVPCDLFYLRLKLGIRDIIL